MVVLGQRSGGQVSGHAELDASDDLDLDALVKDAKAKAKLTADRPFS